MNIYFNPIPILSCLFLGGGAWNPPIGFKKTLKKAERKELKQLQNVKIEPTGNSVRNKNKIF